MITLVVIAPILTEIISGNTPPHALLRPSVSLFLIAAYSLPLLVIRELAVRRRLGIAGLLSLGLAYGILNEGLLAQTLLRAQGVPVRNFDHYLYAGGVNYSWAFVIVPWHALLAVVLPLTLLAWWYPACSQVTWLGRRTFAILGAFVLASVVFLVLVRKPHAQMRSFLVVMAVLVVASLILPRGRQTQIRKEGRGAAAFAFGIVLYLAFFLGPILLAAIHIPPVWYFFLIVAVFAAFGWLGRRLEFDVLPSAAIAALGVYFAASVFNLLGGVGHHSLEEVICGGLLSVVFLILPKVSPRGVAKAAGRSGLQNARTQTPARTS
ncbi:MAG TPA: hypothetical protein VJO53_13805 [Candidatus Acidoferrales bacterium]|nr:hypothetical protein [Candidatus Acidoferrales bacterium]